MSCIPKLYPEAVNPCGPAEGIHYRYFLASRGIFKHVQGCWSILKHSEAFLSILKHSYLGLFLTILWDIPPEALPSALERRQVFRAEDRRSGEGQENATRAWTYRQRRHPRALWSILKHSEAFWGILQCILLVLPKGQSIIIILYCSSYLWIIGALKQCILAVLQKGHMNIIIHYYYHYHSSSYCYHYYPCIFCAPR